MIIFLYIIFGALVGVLSGFFGIGGGFILTPTFLLIGFSPIEAITTSLIYTIGTSISGMFAHFKMKNIYWKEGLIIGIGGMVATQVARPFVLKMSELGWDEVVIPSLYAITLSYFIYRMRAKKAGPSEKTGEKAKLSTISLKLILVGLVAGFASTTLGVGGGFIIVPLIITFLGFDPKKAVGTSLFAVFLIVLVGFSSYAMTITIDYKVGLMLMIGGLFGSQFGARLIRYFKDAEIARLLSTLYAVTLLSVVAKLFQFSIVGIVVVFLFIGYFIVQSIVRVKRERSQSEGYM